MKNMHRRALALCLTAAMSAGLLAGCGGDKQEKTPATQEAAQTQSTQEEATQTETAETSDIYVEPVEGISDDFIRGMDASEVLSLENSGVKYYDYDGNEQDIFKTLADSGVNYIRLRVWNDPYDKDGNGYGGGNCDLNTAVELGKRATEYGMKVNIDFHYSDFWADPKRQNCPKAWEGMDVEEKSKALYDFTKDSLNTLLDAGVDVAMVQIGNEINYGMAGETYQPDVLTLLKSGSKAVREISKEKDHDITIAVHYTNITDNAEVDSRASALQGENVDYDVFGLSFYSFWDGTIENMKKVAKHIKETYGKDVMIAETSYAYTSEDGDGQGNSFVGTDDIVEGYPATVQSQATMVRDICAAANEVGEIGVFYWGGTWIPVGKATDDNSAIWEKYGSGWASSYCADYDPDDGGLYYGGCAWDNQAMFDFTGHPLASLNVFKYLKDGHDAPLAVDFIPDVNLTCSVGDTIELPDKVDVIYNNHDKNTQAGVTWDSAQVDAIDSTKAGTYTVDGTVEGGGTVKANVEIEMINLLKNPSFEDADTSMWKVTYEGKDNPTDFQNKTDDAHTGDIAFHFWSEKNDMDFSIEQEVTDLEPGTYSLMAFSQGGDLNADADLELYAITSDGEQTESFQLTTYSDWKNPTINEIKITDGTVKVGVRMKCNAKSWGTVDDFALYKISD